MRRSAGVVAGMVALFGALACGPSFQAIYEGNARFEHCYALEENAQKPLSEKSDCWRDWSEHYTYGQTRDRIHYATARYVALSQSSNVPTDEAMMMAAPGMTPRQSTITAPAPTNAFEPPPKTLNEDGGGLIGGKPLRANELPKTVIFSSETGAPMAPDAGGPAPGALGSPSGAGAGAGAVDAGAPAATVPAAVCTDPCAGKFRDCTATCSGTPAGDAGKDAPCVACEKSYRACMRACFK